MLIAKLITFIICSLFMLFCLVKLKKGIINSVYIVYLGFYLFFVFPILLDILIGYPNYMYSNFIGFYHSHNDVLTELIYSIFLIYSTVFLLYFGRGREIKKSVVLKLKRHSISPRITIFVLTIVVVIPLLLAISKTVSNKISMVSMFDYNYLRFLFRQEHNFLVYYYICLISVLSFIIILLIDNKNIFINTLIYMLPIYTSISIHGKRNLIAILIFLYTFVIIFKVNLKSRQYKYLILGVIILTLFISAKYQQNIRGISLKDSFNVVYTDFRIDYGRDDVVKMSMYYSIYGDRIMKNHGNSQLYFTKFFAKESEIMRSQYKYSVYATSKLLGYSSPIDLGWGMTTGIYDESISNYGVLLGIILSNVLIVLICRIGDKSNSSITLIFTYITGFLIQVLQLTSFAFIFLLWFFLILRNEIQKLPKIKFKI